MTNDEDRMKNEPPISSRPRLDPANIEVIDDEMVAVLRAKTPAERIAMVFDLHDRVRKLLAAGVRLLYSAWGDEQVQREVARILLHETNESCRLLSVAAAEAELACKHAAVRAWRSGNRALHTET